MAWSRFWRSWLAAAVIAVSANCQQTGHHTDWPRWCGKVYEAGYPSFDPGGQTLPPKPVPGPPLLHVRLQPRYSLYLDSEEYAEFVVDAEFSRYHGTPWPNATSSSKWSNRLIFSINLVETDDPLVQNTVPVNTTGNLFRFELSRLRPSLEPIRVVLYGAPEGGAPTWTVTSSLYYLPDKRNGSITRIDNLRGGLWFKNAASGHRFEPLFFYGFYASHDGFLRNNNTAEIQQYADLGLNAMTPLTTYRDSAAMFAYMDKINLRFMYSLRDGYKNLTYVEENVLAARDAEAIFAYWSADEPDGWQDPFSAPLAAQALIRRLDPYHPVAITLNCQNYYFAEYSAGADFIMEDVYPIGINATWSKWGTECNTTYGDCGCDNCEGTVQDVPSRLDDLARYEAWLGLPRKTKAHNPQAFRGQDYWLREPSADEARAMGALAVNHGARGSVAWLWPTSASSPHLAAVHGEMARVFAAPPVLGFLVGGDAGPGPLRVEVGADGGIEAVVVDAAYWVAEGRALVSVVNGGYVDVEWVRVAAPPNATVIADTPWGSVRWRLEGGWLSVPVLPALATSMVILELRG